MPFFSKDPAIQTDILTTSKYNHVHGKDNRVFQVGHLGYDSYDVCDYKFVKFLLQEEDSEGEYGQDDENMDEDEIMEDAVDLHHPHHLHSTNLQTTSSAPNVPAKFATASNRKRKDIQKWTEMKSLRDKTIKQISAGGYHVICLFDDGSVYSWGWGKLGQLGHGDLLNRIRPVRVKLPWETSPSVKESTSQPLSTRAAASTASVELSPTTNNIRVIRVKGGGRHSILLTNDGRVWTFGCGEDGRLGHGDKSDSLVPKEVAALRGYRVTFIDSAFWHTIAATVCKKVFVFGHGEEGKLGLGDVRSQLIPTEIVQLRGIGILSASGGAWHSVVLTEDHRVYTMGSHYWGQLGVGQLNKPETLQHCLSTPVLSNAKDACFTPIEVVELRDKHIIKVIAGSNFNVCLAENGHVYTFGCGSSGKTGHGSSNTIYAPRLIDSVSHIRMKDVCTGSNHTLLLAEDGRLFSFGWCRYAQLGHGNFDEQDKPKEVQALKGVKVEQIGAGAFFTIISTRNSNAGEKPVLFKNNGKYLHSFCDMVIV